MDLSANIKQAIKAHGYNNSEVAHKLGMQQPNFSRLINSPNIRISDLEKIAEAIGCHIGEMVDPSAYQDADVQRFCPYCGKKIR